VFHNLLMSAAIDTGGDGTGNYSLWSWGYNLNGQLGDGTQISRSSPVQVGSLTDWTPNIAAVNDSIYAIKNDGRLWAWGNGALNSLGLGDGISRSSPVQVGASSDWYYVGRGGYVGYAINTSGELYTVGYNPYGQLGDGTTTSTSYLTQVGSSTNWAACAGGNNFTAAIKTDGTSWSWGRGEQAAYFRDSTTDYSSPVQSGSDTDRWGASSYPPSGGWENGVEMQKVFSCGYWQTSLVKSDGTLWSGGWNGVGGLGFAGGESSPSQVGSGTDWEAVACYGGYAAMGIKDGEGLTWGGYNSYGQLGNGTTSMVAGTHYSWGSTVSRASGSFGQSLEGQTAMIIDGELWVAGRNSSGALGLGNTTNYSSPVQVGSDTNWIKVICTGTAMLGIKEE